MLFHGLVCFHFQFFFYFFCFQLLFFHFFECINCGLVFFLNWINCKTGIFKFHWWCFRSITWCTVSSFVWFQRRCQHICLLFIKTHCCSHALFRCVGPHISTFWLRSHSFSCFKLLNSRSFFNARCDCTLEIPLKNKALFSFFVILSRTWSVIFLVLIPKQVLRSFHLFQPLYHSKVFSVNSQHFLFTSWQIGSWHRLHEEPGRPLNFGFSV